MNNPFKSFVSSLSTPTQYKSMASNAFSPTSLSGKKGSTFTSSSASTSATPNMSMMPSATTTAKVSTPPATNSPAKTGYISSLATSQDNSAQIPGLQSQLQGLQGTLNSAKDAGYGANDQIQMNNNGGVAPKPTDPFASYTNYLKGFQETSNTANTRLADIQNTIDDRSLKARREYESTLDTPGMLRAGAESAAKQGAYRNDQNLADLAIRESAAARSAGVALDSLKNAKPLQIGDNYYDPSTGKLIQAKTQTPSEQYGTGSIGEYQFAKSQGYSGSFTDYQNEDANRKAKAVGAGGASDKLLSVTEAQALGVPYGTTQNQAVGLAVSGKPTAEQSKARQFAVSAENANNILSTVNYNPGVIEPPLPNGLKSEGRQQFEQASRAFVNSVLRRESGATITDDEFKNKYKELIPQAGDGKAVKEQKALARAASVLSIQEAGGNTQGAQTQQNTGGGQPQQMMLNGQVLTLQADGTYE